MRFLILLLLTATPSFAFNHPDTLWVRFYDNNAENDLVYDAVSTTDGGFLLGGRTPNNDISVDYFIVKADVHGNEEWRYIPCIERGDGLRSVIQVPDIGYLVGGESQYYDGLGIMINEDGDSLWSRSYGGSNGTIKGMTISRDGHGVIAGTTSEYAENGSWDSYLVKIDAENEGEVIWRQVYGGGSGDSVFDVILTQDNGFAIAGETRSFGNQTQFYLVKTDSIGEQEWESNFGGEGTERCTALVQTPDGGFALVGYTIDDDYGDPGDIFFVRTDSEGNELWSRWYGFGDSDYCLSMVQTQEGGFVLAGSTSHAEGMYLIRLDCDGEVLWSYLYETADNDIRKAFSIMETDDGGYAVAGEASVRLRSRDFVLLKLGTDIIRWLSLPDSGFTEDSVLVYDMNYFMDYVSPTVYQDSALVFSVMDGEHIYGEFEEERFVITADDDWFGLDSLMLIVTEEDDEENADSTWLHLTVHENNDVETSLDQEIPQSFVLQAAYPNPFNSTVSIRYQLPEASHVKLKIFDISGREVATLVNSEVKSGYHTSTWNANVPSGIYICRMQAGSYVESIKVVLNR
ncbi:MAG: T9SS type A sorting domain-containing protein [Calditrichaeota bacterium]|nr:T9SS type A sorting domain-containing protein [Calditrichota bacterium]